MSTTVKDTRHVVVVGGGLVGISVARALARAGVAVTVVERGVPGAEASWAAGGILSPQAECDIDGPMLRLCLRGLDDMRALEAELRSEQGQGSDAGIGWRAAGTLDVASTEAEAQQLAARVAWQRAAGLQAQWVDGATARARAPVGGDVVGGAWFAGEVSLEPRRLFEQLRASAERAGVRFLGGRRVRNVQASVVELDRDVDGALDAGRQEERLEGDAVVVCAGAWTPGGPECRDDLLTPRVCAAEDPALRVVRGGAWNAFGALVRSASRFAARPEERFAAVGMRLVRSV